MPTATTASAVGRLVASATKPRLAASPSVAVTVATTPRCTVTGTEPAAVIVPPTAPASMPPL
jgi:hypothetical protein